MIYMFLSNNPSSGDINLSNLSCCILGAQLLSGRVLNWRPRGHRLEPHRRHCVVVLEQDTFILA